MSMLLRVKYTCWERHGKEWRSGTVAQFIYNGSRIMAVVVPDDGSKLREIDFTSVEPIGWRTPMSMLGDK